MSPRIAIAATVALTAQLAAARLAMAEPVPDRILLRVTDADGRTYTLTALSGSRATFAVEGMPTVGVTSRASSTKGRLDLVIETRVSDDDWRTVSSISLGSLNPYIWLDVDGVWLGIEWLSTLPSAEFSQSVPSPDSPPSQCCVFCGGITICACRVDAPCGWCCVDACGGCDVALVPEKSTGGLADASLRGRRAP